MEDKYVGLFLAMLSSLAIGSSYVITKIGLRDASKRHGFDGEGHQYLKNPIWWGGMIMLVVGELANFSAYAFAPAILVTPLGALSVLTGSVLGSYFLGERLGVLGKLGAAMCFVGSVIIVCHAPPDKPVETINEIFAYAMQPGFLIFCAAMTIFSATMIYKVCPKYGNQNPLYYLSVCAATGSISVMAAKAFGIALKLTSNGNNQFKNASTYVFIIVMAVCIMTQMNYFNKALNTFSQSVVSPIYYVTFTTAVLVASFILFKGFNTSDTVNTVSLLCGFLVIFSGVFLLNLSEKDPDGHNLLEGRMEGGAPTDGVAGVGTRLSMQSRRSGDPRRNGSISFPHPRGSRGDREHLMHSYSSDREDGRYALDDLTGEDDESENEMRRPSNHGNGKSPVQNGSAHRFD